MIDSSSALARICGSMRAIWRGVNIRARGLRWMVWVGGSSKITIPDGISVPDRAAPPREDARTPGTDRG